MKILILSDDFPPKSFGGAGYSTFYLAHGLHDAGHKVFVVSTVRDKKEEGSVTYKGMDIFRIYTKYNHRWAGYLGLYNPQTVGRVKELMKRIKPDVIHAHNIHHYLSYHCLKIAKKYNKPLFFTARDVISFSYGKMATEKYLKDFDSRLTWKDHLKQAGKRYNPLRNFLIRRYLKYPDKLFAVSNALKSALEQNGIRNVEVSYTGTDVNDWQVDHKHVKEFFKKYDLEGKKIVFFGGRMSELKGGKKIIKIMKKIIKKVPETVLFVAGKKDRYVQYLLEFAKDIGVKNNIILAGWLDSNELKLAYHSSRVVIVPSIAFDSFPRIVLEGMACKKPVIATCFGGAQEVIQNGITGYIINPFNVELMAEKIAYLLKNPKKAEKFGEAGYERLKKHFSLKKHIQDTLFWYQKLMES